MIGSKIYRVICFRKYNKLRDLESCPRYPVSVDTKKGYRKVRQDGRCHNSEQPTCPDGSTS